MRIFHPVVPMAVRPRLINHSGAPVLGATAAKTWGVGVGPGVPTGVGVGVGPGVGVGVGVEYGVGVGVGKGVGVKVFRNHRTLTSSMREVNV